MSVVSIDLSSLVLGLLSLYILLSCQVIFVDAGDRNRDGMSQCHGGRS